MKLLRYLLTAFLVVTAFSDALADDIPYRQQRREIFRQLPVNENSIVFPGDSITDFGLWSEFFGSDYRRCFNIGTLDRREVFVRMEYDLVDMQSGFHWTNKKILSTKVMSKNSTISERFE